MKLYKILGYCIVLVSVMQTTEGCAGKQNKTASANVVTVSHKDSAVVDNPALEDEKQFRSVLAKFKSAVKLKNKAAITQLFHFPLQTLPQWTNDELKNTRMDAKTGLIDQKEFLTYFDDVFTSDAIKLIPLTTEDDLSEIDSKTPENYYQTLQQVTDKGSTLYELQKQYAEDNGKETSFGFVFGRVRGDYKIVSYYRPWPLK